MSQVVYVLKELWRNLYRNPGTTIASVLSLALLFLLFDIFWIAAGTSERFYSNLLSNLQLQVYVSESVSEKDIKSLTLKISDIEGIADVEFISREMARKELAALVGTDLLVGYDESNPLPRSYTLALMPTHLNSEAIGSIETSIMKISGIDKIDYSRQWLEKAESTREIILNVGLILGGLILFTTVVSSANNIRLMTRTRAVGFWQMRLQGAGRIFIATPFVLEGFLIALFSAVLSWLVVSYGQNKISFTQFQLILPTLSQITLFCLAAGVLGFLSGLLGMRKLLK